MSTEELSWDQRARIEALHEARKVLLVSRPFGPSGVDCIDVVNIAEYILTGQDPWSEARPMAMESVAQEKLKDLTEPQPELDNSDPNGEN